jgi:hypothetical protein
MSFCAPTLMLSLILAMNSTEKTRRARQIARPLGWTLSCRVHSNHAGDRFLPGQSSSFHRLKVANTLGSAIQWFDCKSYKLPPPPVAVAAAYIAAHSYADPERLGAGSVGQPHDVSYDSTPRGLRVNQAWAQVDRAVEGALQVGAGKPTGDAGRTRGASEKTTE